MLSIMYPNVMRKVNELTVGLLPVSIKADSIPKLIVKVSKEAILTAKLRQGFLIHLVPYEIPSVKSIGFLATFFDDSQHPYYSGGGLIKELMGRELAKLFISPLVDVHFFNEFGHEMLAYRAEFKSTKKHRDMLLRAVFPSVYGLNQSALLTQIDKWWTLSGPSNDAEAIVVKFIEPLMSEDIVYVDMRPGVHDYHGASGYTMAPLEREEPGAFQEQEIISLLQRTFSSDEIYLAPKRTYDKEEIVDILVVSEKSIILIQAKDSPNIERIINNSLERKRSATNKALAKAVRQVSGAINYMRRADEFIALVNGREVGFDVSGKDVYGLVVVKELFDDDYDIYTPPMIELFEQTGIKCIPLAFSELHQYTTHLTDESEFFRAFLTVFDNGLEHGKFPRLRVLPAGSIVNN